MALTVSVDQIVHSSRNRLLSVRPHWKRIRLGEIASVLNGFAFKSAQFTKGDGMPLIRIRDVESDSTDTNYVGEFDERYIVEPGDLLVGMDGDFNCARWRGPRGLLNQRVCKVTLQSDQYHPRFLDFALPGYLRAINDATSSVTVKHLSSRTIEDIPLPLPTLHEQEEIVAELEKQFSRLDEADANLKRVKANLKRYKAAVLKAAVEGRLVPTEAELARREGHEFVTAAKHLVRLRGARQDGPRGRLGEATRAKQVTSELPVLPLGWCWSDFEAVADRVTVGHVGPVKDEYVAEGIPFLRSQNVRPNRYDPEGLKFISLDFHAKLQKSALEPGDIVVVRSGSVGVACVIPESLPVANCSDLVIIKRPRGVLPGYGAFYLNAVVDSRIAAGRVGVALAHFNTKSVAKLPMPVPPMAEQVRIVLEVERRLSVAATVETGVDLNLERARSARQALLRTMFGGQASEAHG